ncbi:MAG TPA: FAD-dependent oxidoreductase [Chlamydiales bacterium]|nr:FAD-dependent oxidoreductase [Chlamydiales bacterium]
MKPRLLLAILALVSVTASLPAEEKVEDVVIVGGGMGSLTAALYLARAGLHPLVIEGRMAGGLLTQSHSVQNWPGELEIEGCALTEKVRKQAEANGARILESELVHVNFLNRPFVLTIHSLASPDKIQKIKTLSCIIGMGTMPNFLHIPGEELYWGNGVTNCAICDGSLYRGKKVGVVGGGDAAILEALYLSNIVKEVHIFVRKNQLRANEGRRIKTLLSRPNVAIHYDTEVVEIKGDEKKVTGVVLKNKAKSFDFSLDGLFLAIGSRPNSELFKNSSLELDEKGYIVLKKGQETSLPGIYAIGDIVDPVYKQAISAAGDGAKAALQSQQFLMDQDSHLASLKKDEKKSPNFEVIEIVSSEQLKKFLQDATTPIIIDFYANWCHSCKRISSLIESSAQKLTGKVQFFKVNVDKLWDLSQSYEIRSMPTVILLDPSGKVIERKVGVDQIGHLLEQLHAKTPDP